MQDASLRCETEWWVGILQQAEGRRRRRGRGTENWGVLIDLTLALHLVLVLQVWWTVEWRGAGAGLLQVGR